MNTKASRRISKLMVIVFLAVAWQMAAIAARNSGPTFAKIVPTWQEIFTRDFASFSTYIAGTTSNDPHSYWSALYIVVVNTLVTIRRVLLGLLFGGVIGIGSGMLIALQPVIRAMVYPIVSTLRNVPLLALIALFLVWFGGSEQGIVTFIGFGLWVIYCTNTIEAIVNADIDRINFARTLGARKKDVYFEVILPMVVPNLINATKVALGVAWAVALGGEMLAAQNGLGRLMILSENYMEAGRMLIILLLYIVLTTFFDWLVTKLDKWLTVWMP